MFEVIDYKWVLAIAAGIISFCNLLYYLRSVLQGKTKPHMYTWFIWFLVTIIAAVIQFLSGGGAGVLLTSLVALFCLARALIAIPYGEKHITFSDKVSFGFCLVAIVVWLLTNTPLYSLILVTLIDVVAFYPTFRKSYLNPHEENLPSFFIVSITYSMGLFAMGEYNFLTLLYPIAVASFCLLLCLFLAVRRYQLGYKVLR